MPHKHPKTASKIQDNLNIEYLEHKERKPKNSIQLDGFIEGAQDH